MKIIAISGKQGAGKTYLIQQFKQLYPRFEGVKVVKFADPLYELQKVIYETVGLPQPKEKDRKLLQYLGTEWGREKDVDLWVNLWTRSIQKADKEGAKLVFTDDMRFPNEFTRARELGAVLVRVEAPDFVRASRIELIGTGHPSETALDPYVRNKLFKFTLHSGMNQAENDAQAWDIFEEILNENS